ncbi:MAG: hypothetical protein GY719_24160 [bacterium]|nr:hypothetical protein [bacterium]
MAYQRLPESVQTLYAELLEHAIHAEAAEATLGAATGTFVSKKVKGRTYWYLQRMEGDRKRQYYVGPESESLLEWMRRAKEARSGSAADREVRSRLCSMLAAGGAMRETAPVAKVLRLLSDSQVFRWGGVLVGTHAFAAHANMLGVRFDQQTLRTHDVDVAQDPAIGIGIAPHEPSSNVEKALEESGLGFHAVPKLDPRQASTSYKIRGRELRVDFLTPLFGPESNDPVYLPAFKVSAHPLRLLDYLIEYPSQAVIVGEAGILVNVPDPARFALHKLWTSSRRPVAEQAKAAKDLRQASLLIEVLLDDRPADLGLAWDAIKRSKSVARRTLKTIRRLDPELRGRLMEQIDEADPI